MQAKGYMIQDNQGNAIFGVGESVTEAWRGVVRAMQSFTDAYGNTISSHEAYLTQFKVYGATAKLIAMVDALGGDISWRIVRGVACTVEEYEQCAN